MVNALLFLLIAVLCYCGMAWLALAIKVHWQQVRAGQTLPTKRIKTLRFLGAASLSIAGLLCFYINHPTMAPLVWMMASTAGALLVGMTLTWQPRCLVFLVAWIPAGK